MSKANIYLGLTPTGGNGIKYERFRSDSEPTHQTHGDRFNMVIGPFRTVRAACFMANTSPNPHCVCVSQAERLAKKYGPDPNEAGKCH